mgnify:CR=1 FL=1
MPLRLLGRKKGNHIGFWYLDLTEDLRDRMCQYSSVSWRYLRIYFQQCIVGISLRYPGVLVYYGLVHKEATMDMYALMSERPEPIVKGLQKEFGRGVFENWKWLAKGRSQWLKTRAPKFPDEK